MQSTECGIEKEGRDRNQAPDNNDKQLSRAKNAAYRFLAVRPRSRAEVEAKLIDKNFSEATVRDVLSGLERLGYLNDREFARQWAEARIRLRGFGRRRIEQELRTKGIGRDLIAETLGDLANDDAELKTARETVRKKLKTSRSDDRETCRRRLAGFLERKGFSYDVIRAVLSETSEMQAPDLEAG